MRSLRQHLNYRLIILLLLVGLLMAGLGIAAEIHNSHAPDAAASSLVAPGTEAPGQIMRVAFISPILRPNGYAWGD
jgi:hypothetical protein